MVAQLSKIPFPFLLHSTVCCTCSLQVCFQLKSVHATPVFCILLIEPELNRRYGCMTSCLITSWLLTGRGANILYPAMTAFTDQYSLPNIFFDIGQL